MIRSDLASPAEADGFREDGFREGGKEAGFAKAGNRQPHFRIMR
jgi:hypothetical protein